MQANRKRRRLSDKSIINAATLVNAMSPRFFWLTLRTRWENIEANRLHMYCATGSLVRIPAMRRN